jgi:CheY-like chemotaxis protein
MKRTILLADDSPTIQRLVAQVFADAKFKVVSVSNGEAAIKKFDELKPSLVLADIYMPGKNGYEVCAYVKNHGSLATTPVVLLVGAFEAFDEESAKRVGASGSITKPFEPHALVKLVESLAGPPTEDEETADSADAPEREAPKPQTVAFAVTAAKQEAPAPEIADLLGLESIFKAEAQEHRDAMTDDDIDRIADRVIQRLSTQIIENIAWDIVPDITEKIVREELRKLDSDIAASKKHES